MMYAVSQDGARIKAVPRGRAICPLCQDEMIAKCGQVKTWHWAHRQRDCDPWAEGETEWHLYWKSLVSPEQTEVTISKDGIIHRADIVTSSGTVVELQHSAISTDMIREREQFYDRMIWLFDVRQQTNKVLETIVIYAGKDEIQRHQLELFSMMDVTGRPRLDFYCDWSRMDMTRKDEIRAIRWYWPRRFVFAVKKPIYLDMGASGILRLMSYREYYNVGWGYHNDADRFKNWLIGAS